MIRKTKIVCTLGPAVDDEVVLRQMILEGMNIARFNMSHGSHEEHGERLAMLKRLRADLNMPVAALLDTKGPEIRLGDFEQKQVVLKQGQLFTLTTSEILGNKESAYITYSGLPYDVTPGNRILIDDGLVEMEVESVVGEEIRCLVKNTGVISARKGVNVPGAALSLPFINEKDYNDLRFAVEQGFDFVAASFTRTYEDMRELKHILKDLGGEKIKVIAKIENSQGVENLDEILNVPYLVVLLLTGCLIMLMLRKPGENLVLVKGRRIWIMAVCALCVGVTMLSMLIAWTPLSSSVILGVQGRYFLPFLPVFLMACKNDAVVLTKNRNRSILYLMFCVNGSVLLRLFSTVSMRL